MISCSLSALCIQEYLGAQTRRVRLVVRCTEVSSAQQHTIDYGETCRRMQLTAARVCWSRTDCICQIHDPHHTSLQDRRHAPRHGVLRWSALHPRDMLNVLYFGQGEIPMGCLGLGALLFDSFKQSIDGNFHSTTASHSLSHIRDAASIAAAGAPQCLGCRAAKIKVCARCVRHRTAAMLLSRHRDPEQASPSRPCSAAATRREVPLRPSVGGKRRAR